MTTPSANSSVLLRRVVRRNPFRISRIPLLARCYAWPMNKWRESRGRQILFGAPHLFLFSVWRRLVPLGIRGEIAVQTQAGERLFSFDARNSQFQALYLDEFKDGYEPEVAAVLEILLSDEGVFFDIGSNFGYFSVLAATRPGFRGQVHAFEPFFSSYRDLCNIVTNAGLDNLVTPHNLALSDRTGSARMNLPDLTHSGLATMEATSETVPGAVPMTRLDDLNLPVPNLIKIDAEGAEREILRGAEKTIRDASPCVLFENVRQMSNPSATLAPLQFLRDLGHRFFQPVWQRTLAGNECLVPSDGNFHAQVEETLALAPVTVEDRLLRQDQINLLSVPQNRLGKLQEYFSTTAPAQP